MVFAGIFLIMISGAYGFGLIDMPGTVQLPNWFGGDNGGDTAEPRYVVATTVDISTTTTSLVFNTNSFDYDTERCGPVTGCSLTLTNPSESLNWFGARNVQVTTSLVNSNDQKVKEVSQFLGNLDVATTEEVTQRFSNIKPGTYTVQYRVTGTGNWLDNPVDKTFEREIRVPETIQGGA